MKKTIKVMLVDDTQVIRHMLRATLEKIGCEICAEVNNGEQAVVQYKRFSPDIVFMDINMPDMDGIEALTQIKEIDSNAKVIMLTALGKEELIIKAVKAGAAYYLVKPFTESKIYEVLSRLE